MLTGDEIREKLRCLPDHLALSVLCHLADGRVYEAERVAHLVIGADAGDELIASIVRSQKAAGTC